MAVDEDHDELVENGSKSTGNTDAGADLTLLIRRHEKDSSTPTPAATADHLASALQIGLTVKDEDEDVQCCTASESSIQGSGEYAASHLNLQDVVSIEPGLLRHILSYCSDRDILHASQTNTHLYVRCWGELKWRQKLWHKRILEPRLSGRCQIHRFAAGLDDILTLGQLLDQQYDCTAIVSPVTMAKMEALVGRRLRREVRRGDVVHVADSATFSKLSVIAVKHPTTDEYKTNPSSSTSTGTEDHPLCFYRILWRSPRGEAFHVFPKDVYSIGGEERGGYMRYFEPYLKESSLRRRLPTYAILPESSSTAQPWCKQPPPVNEAHSERQQMFLSMFPQHKLTLILELCLCDADGGQLEAQQQMQFAPRLIPYHRFYTPQEMCTGSHNVLWWA